MAKMEPLETSTTLAFHGVSYVVTVGVHDQTLDIQVELEDASAAAPEACWTAQFPANYLEDLTRKTGNYKRFGVFVNMLLSAMAHRSDAVFIDLLTTADLELYRKRKMGRQGLPRGAGTSAANESFDSVTTDKTASSKRYLILTYAVEFDRVHYPLPLNQVDKPTPEILQRTIRRLRQTIASARSEGKAKELEDEMRALREENRCLKATLKSYCGREPPLEGDENGGDTGNGLGVVNGIDLQRELELSMRENKELIGIYQQLREDSSNEMTRLKAEIKQLKLRQSQDVDREAEREWVEARRRLNDSNAAAHEALVQLQELSTQLEETQLKNKELLRQLAIARAKAGINNESGTRSGRLSAAAASRGPGANGSRASVNGNRPSAAPRPLRRQNSFEHFDSSDDEGERGQGYRSSGGDATQRRGFRRFDPTAYQQERQRKLQQRAAQRSPSPSAHTANRQRRAPGAGGGHAGGYMSDSSAGGYSSAGSDASKASRASARSRGRSRVSYQNQRDADARLASPRRNLPPPPQLRSTPQSNRQPQSRGRSPSPARSTNGHTKPPPPPSSPHRPTPRTQTPEPARRAPNARAAANTKSPSTASTVKPKPTAGRKLPRPPALLADTSLDSFSDIDDRLTALQQFLKEAKQGTSKATSVSTAPATDN